MEEGQEKIVRFSFKKTYQDEKEEDHGIIVNVEYSSKTKLGKEERTSFTQELKTFMNDVFDGNKNGIVDIVKGIREITKNLQEGRLNVTINRLNNGEYVYYKNGQVDACGSYKEHWDDMIVVFNNQKGIDVKFKKEGFYPTGEEKVEEMNQELAPLFHTVITLNQMTKDNREIHVDTKPKEFVKIGE